MNTKEVAEKLDGTVYPVRVNAALKAEAKANGIVIVYGASDDLMEFDGAIYDEVGAYEGAEVAVDAQGIIPDFDTAEGESWRNDKDMLRDYFKRVGGGKVIKALWCAETGYSWTYQTDIPHETFDVLEDDGTPYCRGIVFKLSDTAR